MPDAATRIARPFGPPPRPARRSPRPVVIGVLAVLLAAGGILATMYMQLMRERDPSLARIEPEHADPITDLPVATAIPVEIEAPPVEEPPSNLPALDESDAELLGWLTELLGAAPVTELFVPERLIRNIVVTVDNLPRVQVVPQQRPLRPTPGAFVTEGTEDELYLAPANYERYSAVMLLVRNTDPRVPAALYRRFRPLFQQAYEELGFPTRSFHTRLIEVVDHLLATPDVRGRIRLVQPRVFYEYADPQLERLSAGQKLLIRMGPDNAAVIKAKLRELRAELLLY